MLDEGKPNFGTVARPEARLVHLDDLDRLPYAADMAKGLVAGRDQGVVVQDEDVALERADGARRSGVVLGEEDHALADGVAFDALERERDALACLAVLDVDALALDALDGGRDERAERVGSDEDVVADRDRAGEDDAAYDGADERDAEAVGYAHLERIVDREATCRVGRDDVEERLEER